MIAHYLVLLCIALHSIDASVIPSLLSQLQASGSTGNFSDANNSSSNSSTFPSFHRHSVRQTNFSDAELYVTLPEQSTADTLATTHEPGETDEIGAGALDDSLAFVKFHNGPTTARLEDSSGEFTTTAKSSHRGHHHKYRDRNNAGKKPKQHFKV